MAAYDPKRTLSLFINMSNNIKTSFIAAIFFLVLSNTVLAKDACEPRNSIISSPNKNQVKKCIHSLWFYLGRRKQIDVMFANSFISSLLPKNKDEEKVLSEFPYNEVDHKRVAEIISLMRSKELIQRYIDFAVFYKDSSDEIHTFGLGKLFTLQVPMFLEILSTYKENEQQIIISKLGWGLLNNFLT